MSSAYVMKPRVKSVPTKTATPYWTRVLQQSRARFHRGEKVFTAANRNALKFQGPVRLAAAKFGIAYTVAKRDPTLNDLSGKFTHYVQERDNCFAAFHVLRSIEARCKAIKAGR